jgi:hypothetical protein
MTKTNRIPNRFQLRTTAAAVALAVCAALPASMAQAQSGAKPAAAPAPAVKISDGVVKIGLLLDMSSLYADVAGNGTVDRGEDGRR